ncbi:MAG: flippase-like domain-containing protein [Chloroflexaceae bacterium]|jgi:uncharacterized protein (TIRG00374 family)|nr:flippase-like domain-containing protein [Chloroflexaceae bacterium]
MGLHTLRGKIFASLGLGLLVLLVLALVSDGRQVAASFGSFSLQVLPVVLGFTMLNYGLRWLKWEFFLRYLKLGNGVSRPDSGLIFTSGMVMAVTPGKVGEVFKSYLLKRVNGTGVSVSAPIVLAERLTDGLAMLLLMGLGLTLYPPARPLFVALLIGSVVGIVIIQNRALSERLLALAGRLPLGNKLAPRLSNIYHSTAQLLHWRVLLPATLLSVVSWGCECLAFFLVLTGFQVEPSALLLLQATFVYAASTLFGLVSFLPGGLGVSEATSAGMLVAIVGMSGSAATAATIIIRFCTLWFGVLLGVVALALFGRRYRSDEREDSQQLNTEPALSEVEGAQRRRDAEV